ncbi:Rha family transcriptional regulator [Xenorhabdus sp. PB62.4]|uniref:Rha family transcriptional regulator n=1 Tax=Xenorhabdus sp. PB62.4 TaxID=1851573 RepID=UPI0016571DF9|nr:Rha family transcriptional regulator [Xenorhabdus sp. PB62.4]MBC8954884.1 putative phage anti-repressor protein [Xenorhabdus sp. PB62.4]
MQNVTFLALTNESENINPLMMSSREIAELTDKRHTDVIRDIWVMLGQLYSLNKDDANLRHDKNQEVTLVEGVIAVIDNRGYVSEFLLDRRHTEILITGYDVKRRAAVIDRWFALESGTENPIGTNISLTLPQNYIEALEALLISEKEKANITEERDEAVRTKAQISRKREATALQRNSAYQRVANRAIREREEMAARFGASKEWASQQAVWRATGIMYGWKVLNAWLDENNIYDPVTDGYPMAYNIYQNCHEVIYPRQAWLEVHGVDISELF